MTTSHPHLLRQAHERQRGERIAIVDDTGAWSYDTLVASATAYRDTLLGHRPDLRGERIAYFVPPGLAHVAAQWAIWGSGGVAVPLAASHPLPELEYVLDDSAPALLVVDRGTAIAPELVEAGRRRQIPVVEPPVALSEPNSRRHLEAPPPDDPGLMIYTSGTTGRPKGVVTTHANLTAQIHALVSAWEWSPEDRILHVLPLHHVHGIVNVLSCALWSGATCVFAPPDPEVIWDRLATSDITLFMAVPTVYRRLIQAWERAAPAVQDRWSEGAGRLRLMVSGSAALPVATLERWRELTGHTLLERYGMTEIGMGLSNPLHGERRPGHVGRPLPGVEVRLVDEAGRIVPDGSSGEIEVRGPQVFREYWRRPEDTKAAFHGPWFRTGDSALVSDGYYRILGRQSVDILKSGGYKISALETEDAYREHPAVEDVAVVGVPDPDWGERVCAALTLAEAAAPDVEELRSWGKQRLAPYKVPREFKVVAQLPRNAMGKVQKRLVAAMFSAVVTPPTPEGPS